MTVKDFKKLPAGTEIHMTDRFGKHCGTLRLVYNGQHFARVANPHGVETRLVYGTVPTKRLINNTFSVEL